VFLKASNLLTYGSLLFGLLAVAGAHATGNPHVAGLCLTLVVLADTFDGRFARRFKRSPHEVNFGVQLDSLSDAAALGLARVAAIGMLLPSHAFAAAVLWWTAAFAYVVSAVTRLGAYTIHEVHTRDFTGMPTPLAALVCATFLLFTMNPFALAAIVLACAVLMLSPLKILRPEGHRLAAFAIWAAAVGGLHAALLFLNL
jgi:CDP-diacylglycerol--serine O-phosphatidyltransferase